MHERYWERCGKVFVTLLALNGVLFPLVAVWWLEGQRSPEVIEACPTPKGK